MDNIKVKSFSKSKVSFPLPYLISIETESWKRFWDKGLKELFEEISPIRDYTGKELELWFLDYKLDPPKHDSDLKAKQNDASYEASLRAKTRLVNLKTKEIKEQEVFLADFPLMTERGTFVVNGVERVVVSQLIRSPGAFFTSRSFRGKNYFGGKIIPNRGAWLEFETEESGFVGVKINRKRKGGMSVMVIFKFGLAKLLGRNPIVDVYCKGKMILDLGCSIGLKNHLRHFIGVDINFGVIPSGFSNIYLDNDKVKNISNRKSKLIIYK